MQIRNTKLTTNAKMIHCAMHWTAIRKLKKLTVFRMVPVVVLFSCEILPYFDFFCLIRFTINKLATVVTKIGNAIKNQQWIQISHTSNHTNPPRGIGEKPDSCWTDSSFNIFLTLKKFGIPISRHRKYRNITTKGNLILTTGFWKVKQNFL